MVKAIPPQTLVYVIVPKNDEEAAAVPLGKFPAHGSRRVLLEAIVAGPLKKSSVTHEYPARPPVEKSHVTCTSTSLARLN